MKKLKIVQRTCSITALVGAIALGVEIFVNKIENLDAMYTWGVLTFGGLLGNMITTVISLVKGKDEE